MSETAADYEPFARASLPKYGLERASLTLLSYSENATYLAELDGERSVVRVHRPGYNSLAEVESELAWMESVRSDSAIRTPAVRLAGDGNSVVAIEHAGETRLVDVFEFIPGISAEDACSGISFSDLGAVTASLHQHVQAWTPPAKFVRFRWDLDSMLGETGRWGDWRDAPNLTQSDCEVIETAERSVRERLLRFGTGAERFGLVHADLRMSNLIVRDGEIIVIDFDDCGWSWFLTDLAAVITWNEASPTAHTTVETWLRGYLSVGQLDDAAIAEVPTFIMLRRLMITAWIGTHPESEPARTLGPHLAAETASLAQRYLTDPTWFAFDADSLRNTAGPDPISADVDDLEERCANG
ncbi:phosphotransferase enzyme family protein [Rhodococcus jostii]|uniref:phosphotransferase enzyme family protein n=1 Tax=Rhodococcus jostii TaxID=132919 RepID=UPI003658E7E1